VLTGEQQPEGRTDTDRTAGRTTRKHNALRLLLLAEP